MLLCFSHLRWDFVWQRPQHLLSRMSRRMDVTVVEEPVIGGDVATLRIREEGSVTVITPLLPEGRGYEGGFGPRVNRTIRQLLAPLVPGWMARNGREPILWYYTPMALGAEPPGFEESLVVFDAMDELAAFRYAPTDLVEREAALMAQADLVFTGGPSLYRARQHRHPAVHCFPSGVEESHFAQARLGLAPAADIADLPRPVVGFYGVIDERIDLDLVDAIAAAHPEWTVAMVGPTAKIDPADLPRRENIVWLGKRSYAELPSYLAGFDVALLPFAMNAATRFISPTKTLEYMAAGRPIVSTPVADVIDLYGEVVNFGETHDEFVRAIGQALDEPAAVRELRQARARRLLVRHGWDAIAAQMADLIDLTRARRFALPVPQATAGSYAVEGVA
jgi:UDP-galactopyranose mutase